MLQIGGQEPVPETYEAAGPPAEEDHTDDPEAAAEGAPADAEESASDTACFSTPFVRRRMGSVNLLRVSCALSLSAASGSGCNSPRHWNVPAVPYRRHPWHTISHMRTISCTLCRAQRLPIVAGRCRQRCSG